ncbi:MAG: histidine kinase [Cytophagaceae bacterium]|nr:histidine kinase [Gemmatimonadaceae bacterium]
MIAALRDAGSTTDVSPTRSASRDAWWLALAIVGLTTLFALVYVLRLGMSAIEQGEAFAWGLELAKVLAHWWASLPFVVPLAWLVRRVPIERHTWARHAPVLLAGTVLASVARALLDPALAMLFDVPVPPLLRATRVFAALGSFLAVVVMLHAVHFYREMRARELDAVRLARSLSEAQVAASEARLATLRSQLNPHFLFNTLNAITALVHHEPALADRMLTRTAALLRRVLNAPAAEEHALREELGILDEYLDVMALRFGPRLTIERCIDPGVLGIAVPWLVLQPLAENALEHGIWPRPGPGVLSVQATRDGDRLRLVVQDDGVGMAPRASGSEPGVGLTNTRRRLAHLHGDAASLTVEPHVEGGTRVVVLLPLREHRA